MIETLDGMRDAVAGTTLEGRELVELRVPVSRMNKTAVVDPGAVFAVEITPSETLDVWQAARSLVDTTGRWPVVTCSWDFVLGGSPMEKLAEELDRSSYEWELAGPSDPVAIVERSLHATEAADTLLAAREVERASEEDSDDREAPDVAAAIGAQDWFEPQDLPTGLLFLPTPLSEHALAYRHWYGASDVVPSHVAIAIIRRWRVRYGAELVAHWDTMLQFIVGNPPATIEDARALAREQILLAPCTTYLLGIGDEAHAQALLQLDHWFIHERP